jgi:hypothetical protein
MRSDLVFFKTLAKSNVVFLKNPSKKREFHLSGGDKGKVKKITNIQYSEGAESIITEEIKKIDPTATTTPLFTKNGTFRVSDENPILLEFLRATEQNEANGGDLFKEVNVKEDEEFEVQAFEAYDSAINAVMGASYNEVRALALEFISPSAVTFSIQKIKIDLRKRLGREQHLVDGINEFMGAKISEEKLLVAIALKEEIISIEEGRKVRWTGGELFFTASQSKDINTELSLWLKNDTEGRQYLKAISDKLPKKK